MQLPGLIFECEPCVETKVCYLCGKEKPLTDFLKHKREIHGRDARCKDCYKENSQLTNKLKKYASPKPDRCECCGRITKKLCLDHDKKRKTARGWICHKDNLTLGRLGDDLEGVYKHFENYINYLKKYE